MEKVNLCGVSETEWGKERICRACGSEKTFCEVRDEDIVDARIYRFAEKNGLLVGGRFSKRTLEAYVAANSQWRSIPGYIQTYVAVRTENK